jgi:hypothetical protein
MRRFKGTRSAQKFHFALKLSTFEAGLISASRPRVKCHSRSILHRHVETSDRLGSALRPLHGKRYKKDPSRRAPQQGVQGLTTKAMMTKATITSAQEMIST